MFVLMLLLKRVSLGTSMEVYVFSNLQLYTHASEYDSRRASLRKSVRGSELEESGM
jgi:hypothetical protein